MKYGDEIIFGTTTYQKLLEDIYDNSNNKKIQINTFLDKLGGLVTNSTDAALLVPIIKEYLDVSVKNNEHLIKLALVIQRLLTVTKPKNDENLSKFELLPESEKEQLLKDVEQIKIDKENKTIEHLETKAKNIIKNIENKK